MTVHLLDVLADQPFAEIGRPVRVLDDPARDVLVVAGDLGHTQWLGNGDGVSHYRVAVYDRSDLTCRQVAATGWRANDLAIHPSGRWVAVATGSYDGGYHFEGELIMIDLERGTSVSVLRAVREVVVVHWLDETRLHVELSPVHDDCAPEDLHDESFVLTASWGEVAPRSIELPAAPGGDVTATRTASDADTAHATLGAAAARTGRRWAVRRRVAVVAGRSDGSVLAAGEGVAAERWAPDGRTSPVWRRGAPVGAGCQLAPLTSTTVLTTVATPGPGGPATRGSEHDVLDVATGDVLASVRPGGPSISIVSCGSFGVLRGAAPFPGREPTAPALVVGPDGSTLARLDLPHFVRDAHWFDIVDAPAPLVLTDHGTRPHVERWVERVDLTPAGAATRRLFPLDWDAPRDRLLDGGPGAFVDDAQGEAVVHSATAHEHPNRQRRFLVRRTYPTGAVQWVTELPARVTGVATSDGVLAVTTADGRLLLVDALTGATVDDVELRVHGQPVVPLCVSAYGDGRLAVGLLDGRILRLRRE
ncbi:hypothetical protein Cfla_3613 [Cellulomonas flavigena DSM 20109]|uniref:Uncharacterized protein n=1 Tax=Cellulomonas flavigena (strain ATCC 482 / DSM 20109 / BCRC 11376 / JCM 18109 / NBRC 3775 / NCIMB 8073 / NRS 134) TaxID=446466 RepID=D5UDM8_CELFN|nr:PQQ-binding-like beta-propeller repeat protein [Cellulomonas flavigena]ADG76484.1 hypothetical protein Cfla_3613 [Cellulomonas flavigena DSM 20109]